MKTIFYFTWLLSIGLFSTLSACNPTPVAPRKSPVPEQLTSTPLSIPQLTITLLPESTPGSEDNEQQQLENYIVDKLAGTERQHRYVIAVQTQDTRAPLPITKEAIQSCSRYKDNVLQPCRADDFITSLSSEGDAPWNYSYVVFSIVAVNDDFTQATVRLDEIAGPGSRQGILYLLTRQNNQWEMNSQKIIWAS